MKLFAIKHFELGLLLCPTKGEGLTYSRFLNDRIPLLYTRKSSAKSALTKWLGGKKYMGELICDGSIEMRLKSECGVVEVDLVEVRNEKAS